MKNSLIEIIRGDAAPVKVLTLGYALPTALGLAVILLGKPIRWGPIWPTILLGLLMLHQAVMIVALWRSAKGKSMSVPVALARGAAVFAGLMLPALAILALKTAQLNLGDDSAGAADTRSAPAAPDSNPR